METENWGKISKFAYKHGRAFGYRYCKENQDASLLEVKSAIYAHLLTIEPCNRLTSIARHNANDAAEHVFYMAKSGLIDSILKTTQANFPLAID